MRAGIPVAQGWRVVDLLLASEGDRVDREDLRRAYLTAWAGSENRTQKRGYRSSSQLQNDLRRLEEAGAIQRHKSHVDVLDREFLVRIKGIHPGRLREMGAIS